MDSYSLDLNATAEYSTGISHADLTWQALVILLTSAANILLLYVLIFKIKDWTYSNICFISLSLSDFVEGAVAMPLMIVSSNIYNLNQFISYLMVIVEYSQPQVQLYTIVILSWHRLRHLLWPTQSTEQITKLRVMSIVGIWLFSYSAWIVVLILTVILGYYDYTFNDLNPPNYIVLIFDIVFYLTPLTIDCFLIITTIIFLKLRAKRRKTRPKQVNFALTPTVRSTQQLELSNVCTNQRKLKRIIKPSRTWLNRDKKALLCLISLGITYFCTIIFYLICWPLTKYNVLLNSTVYIASMWIGYSSSLFNPLILFIFHDKVQSSLIKMIRRDWLNTLRYQYIFIDLMKLNTLKFI